MTDFLRCELCKCRDERVTARDGRNTHPYQFQCYNALERDCNALRTQLESLRQHVAFSPNEQQQLFTLVRDGMTHAIDIHWRQVATEDNVKHLDAAAHRTVRKIGEVLGLTEQAVGR